MQTASKKVVNGWAMYDWANSVYNLVITTTFFPAYYAALTSLEKYPDGIPFMGRMVVNTSLKNYFLAFSFLVIVLISPILSSIADYKGNKKNFMKFFCYLGALSCSLIYVFDTTTIYAILTCFAVASIGFYGSQVFYNSYLPEIAAESDRDRVSAKGYSFGYVGSVLLQLVGFGLVMTMEDQIHALKITFLLVGLWWIGFAQITFNVLPIASKSERQARKHVLVHGFHELKIVWHQLMKLPVLKRFLLAFFLYSMGVQTVLLVGIDFGIKELQLEDSKLIIAAVIIQIVAIIGAIGMARLSHKYGNLRVLLLTVCLWIGVCLTAYFIQTELQFYILASLIGLMMGGIQSLSRSTYSKFMPETKDTASFFSFYDVTEKLSMGIGILAFAIIEDLTQSMRNSVLVLIVFFVLGLIALAMSLRSQHTRRKMESAT